MRIASRAAAAALALAVFAVPSFAQKGETVKIAVIDPLSGMAAVTGTNQLKTAKFYTDILNRSRGNGPRYEILGLDSKLDPKEAVVQVKKAIESGARFITQGNGSAVALAVSEAVAAYNEENPGKEVLYVNQAGIDPALTNDKCNFWHFRIDADVSMRMEAVSAFVQDRPDIKKVYLFNQNYSFGQQVAKYARERIKARRLDV